MNAYTPTFFQNLNKNEKRLYSATTIASLAANIDLLNLHSLINEQAVYHDLTNNSLREQGYYVPIWAASKAGKIIAEVSKSYDFSLYEYFLTDYLGHNGTLQDAVRSLEALEKDIYALLDNIDLKKATVLLLSDHGNIKDFSAKKHTTNPAMGLFWRPFAKKASEEIEKITDVADFVMSII
ncbi:MAG: hypothetical protein P9M03_11590 [Candidatus Theseobacter exili]|nr:hypothetical protein [Candidatus Theseobacter exili]